MLGRKLSHYDVLDKLGEGGMGVVYLARDAALDRLVALKFLPPGMVDSEEKVARFLQEARAISALNHPHIATIYGMEQADGHRFLALEYLPGGTLRHKMLERRLRNERMPLRQAIQWTMQIGEGLAHAHRRGIVHRDVKASNILFTDDDRIKIADFGLAKRTDAEDADLTDSGVAIGTPRSMSPEQALGRPVDERSDIFSLGLVLFELITGKTPFQSSSSAGLLHEIVNTPAPAVGELRPGVPEAIAAAIAKALEKDPEARHRTMDEFVAVLRGPQCLPNMASNVADSTITLAVQRHRGWRGRSVALGAALVAATIIGAGMIDARLPGWGFYHPRSLPAEKRIAVLEFKNIGGDPQNQALADGLMEVVSNSLTRIERGTLLVAPAADVRKERVSGTGEAWRKLGANLAITGCVRRNGDAVEVMINLVDTRSVTQLRTDVVKTGLADPSLSDRVVESVARMLDPQDAMNALSREGRAPGAERYYLEGAGALHLNDRPETIESAIAAFAKAVALDDKYGLAYAGLAEAQWRKYSVLRDADAMNAALENCRRALALNPNLSAVQATAGMVDAGRGRYADAVREFQRALELDPRSADAYRELATAYSAMGRIDLAEATYKKAVDLRPDAWWTLKQMGLFYLNHGRFSDAERYFTRVIALIPSSAKAHNNLAAAYLKMGRKAEATAELEKAIEIEPIAAACSNLGYLYYMDGRFNDAAEQFEKATELVSEDSAMWGNLADAYRWAPGLEQKAPAAFRRAIELIQREIAINAVDAQLHSRLANYWAALGLVAADGGERSRARKKAAAEIAEALHLGSNDGTVQFQAAMVFEQANRRKRALAALEAALGAGPEHREEILKDPSLRNLRRDNRFAHLWGAIERRKGA